MAQRCLTINKFAIVSTYLSALLRLLYFTTLKMAVLLPALLLIVKRNYQQKMQARNSHFHISARQSGRNRSIQLNYLQFIAELC